MAQVYSFSVRRRLAVIRRFGGCRRLVILENACDFAQNALLFLGFRAILRVCSLVLQSLVRRGKNLRLSTAKDSREKPGHCPLLVAGFARLRSGDEGRGVIVLAGGSRQSVRGLIELHIDNPGRLRKLFHVRVFGQSRSLLHELGPDRRRRLRPAQPQIAVIVISYTNDAEQVRRISREPAIVRTPSLSRGRKLESAQE